MSLLDKIDTDRTQARRDGKPEISTFLGYLLSESRRVGKDADNRDSTDEEVVGVIRKVISRNEENIALTNGSDVIAVWQNKLLTQYLPTQLDEAKLTEIIKGIISPIDSHVSAKHIGIIMRTLKTAYPGQYNPQLASQIIKKLLHQP